MKLRAPLIVAVALAMGCGGGDEDAGPSGAEAVRATAEDVGLGEALSAARAGAEEAREDRDYGRMTMTGAFDVERDIVLGSTAVSSFDVADRRTVLLGLVDENHEVQVQLLLDVTGSAPGEEEGSYSLVGVEQTSDDGASTGSLMLMIDGLEIADAVGGEVVIEASDREGVRGGFDFTGNVRGAEEGTGRVEVRGSFAIPWAPLVSPWDEQN